jgi:hypothetical protein
MDKKSIAIRKCNLDITRNNYGFTGIDSVISRRI